MKSVKGFTLIELMIIVGVIAIMIAIAIGAVTGKSDHVEGSYGLNGYTEVRCIDGYKFVIGEGGQARQVMDEYGHVVTCERRPTP